MLGYFQQAEEMLRPLGRVPRVLNVSPRLAVQFHLDDGMIVELGRQQAKALLRQRLERFVEYYPSLLSLARQRAGSSALPSVGPALPPVGSALPSVVVDMRYPNGFALRVNALSAATATERKGKP
jgi:cell division protein FtsQ